MKYKAMIYLYTYEGVDLYYNTDITPKTEKGVPIDEASIFDIEQANEIAELECAHVQLIMN